MVYYAMEEAIIQVGLPVKCNYGDCGVTGNVKPDKQYGGWYKSKMFRMRWKKQWYCPEHYEQGREIDNRFYENWKTPDPYTEKDTDNIEEELYALLD